MILSYIISSCLLIDSKGVRDIFSSFSSRKFWYLPCMNLSSFKESIYSYSMPKQSWSHNIFVRPYINWPFIYNQPYKFHANIFFFLYLHKGGNLMHWHHIIYNCTCNTEKNITPSVPPICLHLCIKQYENVKKLKKIGKVTRSIKCTILQGKNWIICNDLAGATFSVELY